jgi:predicted acylesterase/phospholipase RssA
LTDGDDPPVIVDVMSGASAGSITALLAARTLLEGHDPRTVMHGAWVERDSIGNLLAHGGIGAESNGGLLSIGSLRDMATALLDPAGVVARGPRQSHPIQLSFSVACLRGLEYNLPRLGREPITASTFLDFFERELAPGTPAADITGPPQASLLDAALASAANALGFPPYLLDRAAEWAAYQDVGVTNLPPGTTTLWYTDGGTSDNEPLGRTLDLTNRPDPHGDDAAARLHLLIHPHPTAAVQDDSWAHRDVQPTFVQAAVRALDMQRSQSLFADLKQVEKTNTRIAWLARLQSELGGALAQLSDADQALVREAVQRVQASIDDDHDALHRQANRPAPEPGPGPAAGPADVPLGEALSVVLAQASGLWAKKPARVDVISPLSLPEARDHSVEEMLSGEVLFHFGGFLSDAMRQNDFDLGYSSTLAWLRAGALVDAGLDQVSADRALQAAEAAYQPGDGWKQTGTTTVGSLLAMQPWQTARLVGRLTHVLMHDAMHHPAP